MAKIKPTAIVSSQSSVPTPHQTGRTDFPYPAFRVRFGFGVAAAARVSVGDFASTQRIPSRGLRPRPSADIRTSAPPSLRSYYRSIIATTQDSDFQTDHLRLTGRAGLCVGLNFGLSLVHRAGPPCLADTHLTDVLTTLTPTEFAGFGDWVSCKQRPSHLIPGARRLRAFNITRLIRCGSSSFRPVGSVPILLSPPALRPGQATGCSVANRLNSTGGTCTLELRTLRRLLRADLFIAKRPHP